MKTLISLNCPNCNATLNIEEQREILFCQYCGRKILLNDENRYTYHHIDEAAIKRAETEQLIRLRELELEEKEEEKRRKSNKAAYIIAIVLFIIGLLTIGIGFVGLFLIISGFLIAEFTFIGNLNRKKTYRKHVNNYETRIISELANYKEKHYETIVAYAKRSGFTNIQALPLKDLNFLQVRKNGQVETVTINGYDDFDEGDIFPKNASIIIMYHSTK